MTEEPSRPHRLADAVRRGVSGVRPVHVAVVAGVAVTAIGLLALRAVSLPEPRPVEDGDRLRIEVVQPIEPKIGAGSVMEVGDLVDGFTHIPAPPPETPVPEAYAPHDAWEEAVLPPPPRSARPYEEADVRPPPQPERPSRRDRIDRWFGFDAPRRDYQSEREARRARLDALDRREDDRERERAWRDRREDDRSRWREPRRQDDLPPPDRWD